MSKDLIRKALIESLSNLSEEKVPGVETTEKTQKEEDKLNKGYYKDVKKKMGDYDNAAKQEDKDAVAPAKYNYEGSEEEYHDEMEIRNGQEMLKYDRDPNKRFKERAEMALKGDPKMGNDVKTGKWNPETGEGNGNTEAVWGASNDKFGEELIKTIKSSAKKREDAEETITQFGDDIELSDRPSKKRKVAVEHTKNNKPEIKNKMKKLTFKKEFNSMDNALSRIPEKQKINENVFVMTDGNETYKVRWEGTVTEGEAIVLEGSNQEAINEDIAKIKHLMGYNSKDELGVLKGQERIDENAMFSKVWDMTAGIITEEEGSTDVITEGKEGVTETEAVEETREVPESAPEALPAEEETGSTGINEEEEVTEAEEVTETEAVEEAEEVNEGDERIESAKEGDWDDAANGSGDGHAEHVMEEEEVSESAEEVTETEAVEETEEVTETEEGITEAMLERIDEFLHENQDNMEEGLRDFLGVKSKEDMSSGQEAFNAELAKYEGKNIVVNKEALLRQAVENKFRGKLVPVKSRKSGKWILIYREGKSGLQKLATGTTGLTGGA